MKMKRVAVGNTIEAFIEDGFSDGLNIIASDENNKGKTVVIQSMFYALGNKPIFPSSFSYKEYYHFVEFEHNEQVWKIVRCGDSFVLKGKDGIMLFDGVSDLKRYWTNNVFSLPIIPFNGAKCIVDMELFVQLFFVGQDGRDTSTIFNAGFYHKEDYINMLLSYAESYSDELTQEETRRIKEQISALKAQRKDKINLCEFYKETSPATQCLSRIKDQEAFNQRVADMESISEQMVAIRKQRSQYASKKVLWGGTLKELRSLNRTIEVGELRCMDCDSPNIAFNGTGKIKYSFDVSTPEIRAQIIESIQAKIDSLSEEIIHCDYEIEKLQSELNLLMEDDDISIENIVALKSGFHNAEEVEIAIKELDDKINALSSSLEVHTNESTLAKEKRDQFYSDILSLMNSACKEIDPECNGDYRDLFTKRGSVISGSEETVFYAAKLIAIANIIMHSCPIVMDSFRAEDLSTEKEHRLIDMLAKTHNQCILTTTLKAEEQGKYSAFERPSQNLCKPPMWCKVETAHWR